MLTLDLLIGAADLSTGKRAYERGDYTTALKEFLRLADQGDSQALLFVGSMLFDGKGLHQDKKRAIALFELAADEGSAEAELRLATLYGAGEGVQKDAAKAMYWNRRAADHGLPLAQFGMGWLTWAGQSGSPDRVQAYMWFSLCSASTAQCAKAQNLLITEMSAAQIDEAKQRVKQWLAKHGGVAEKKVQ